MIVDFKGIVLACCLWASGYGKPDLEATHGKTSSSLFFGFCSLLNSTLILL